VRVFVRPWFLSTFLSAAVIAATMTASLALNLTVASHSRLLTTSRGLSVHFVQLQKSVPHVVRMSAVARQTASQHPSRPATFGDIDVRMRFTEAQWESIKRAAPHNALAPIDHRAGLSAMTNWSSPGVLARMTGMTDNGLICGYFGSGCQPPDMAVAASPNWTVQFVNTSIAIFDKHGNMVLGFPVDAPTFFGIPAPGSCAPFGIPFTSDPRAFYDPNDQRFVLAIGNENGYIDTCPFSVQFYVAVSQTSDPTGFWNVYAFNEDPLGVGGFGDYTELGFDASTVYLGMNLFPVTSAAYSTCPFGYCWAQTLLIDKKAMESGGTATVNLLYDYLNSGGFPLDTVQPTQMIAPTGQAPSATALVSADNFFGATGNGCSPTPCNSLYVWGVSSPLSLTPKVSEITVTAPGWTYPPNGDEPGCGGCMETIDSRITGTPIYSPYNGGTVSFALGTGVKIGTLTWPSNLWGELSVKSSGGSLTGATFAQGGYIDAIGQTNSFADTMLTPSGTLYVVSDLMSPTIYPGWVYRTRQAGDPAGSLRSPVQAQPGLDAYVPMFGVPGFGNLRWGDFEAASYTGFSDNAVWLASQYGNTDYDWGTSMAKTR
jgi:hypothetical protein